MADRSPASQAFQKLARDNGAMEFWWPEELEALLTNIPGFTQQESRVTASTAASAAAASICHPLTERGETDTFAVTTGTCRPGDANPDRARLAHPGTSMAFYMAVERAAVVRDDLIGASAPAECPVEIVASVSTPQERHVSTTLGALAETIAAEGIRNPAILFVRYPKSLARAIRGISAVA